MAAATYRKCGRCTGSSLSSVRPLRIGEQCGRPQANPVTKARNCTENLPDQNAPRHALCSRGSVAGGHGDLPQVLALLGLFAILRPSSAERADTCAKGGRQQGRLIKTWKKTSASTGSASPYDVVLRQLLLKRARRRRHASGAQGVSGQRKGAAHAHCSLPPARKATRCREHCYAP